MWRINRLVVVCGLAFSLLPSANLLPQNHADNKPATADATEAPAASQQPKQPADSTSTVSDTQPVITIHGVCGEGEHNGQGAGACNTVITRKEFESLMNALNPGGQSISPMGRQNLAQAYVEALAFTEAARKSGMDESAQVREVLYWARLRTIADLYRRNLKEEFLTPSPEEIDAYYQQHLPSFESVHLLRILVPRENFSGGDKAEFDKKALAAAQTAFARAKKGDALEQIQKDAYANLGLERPPASDLGTFRRGDFIEAEAREVFSLQPGEVSRMETEVKSYVIYKVASKETLSLAQVRAEIVREISQQKYREAVKAVMDSAQADFNEQYFGPMAPKPPMEAPDMTRRPAH
jgi:hypothetical protein